MQGAFLGWIYGTVTCTSEIVRRGATCPLGALICVRSNLFLYLSPIYGSAR